MSAFSEAAADEYRDREYDEKSYVWKLRISESLIYVCIKVVK